MSYIVEKSAEDDFKNGLAVGQLQAEISMSGIGSIISILEEEGAVSIKFQNTLTAPQLTALDAVFANHLPTTNRPGNVYDAIVNATGEDDYKTISEAINANHSHIFVRQGVYVEPVGFNFTGKSIKGENGVGCIVFLAGQASNVRADASLGVKEDTGTITVTKYSKTIIGAGTSFTNINDGDFIALGTNYFEIASIEDDTHLTLVDMYVGGHMVDVSYIAQKMDTGTHMSNILIVGSTTTGLYLRGQRHYFLDSVAVKACGNGTEIVDCGDSSARQLITESCGANGVIIDNCRSLAFSVIDSYNHPGNGIMMIGNNISIAMAQCELTSCGTRGMSIGGTTEDVAITNTILKFNDSDGLYVGTGCSNIAVSNAVMCKNGGMGARIDGKDIKISSGCSCENGDVGILINGNDSNCVNVTVRSNTDGIRVSANDCIVTGNRVADNSLDGLHIEAGATDTLAHYNNLKGNITNNLVDNGTGSNTTGCKI
jgi:hypothetical protein